MPDQPSEIEVTEQRHIPLEFRSPAQELNISALTKQKG